MLNKNQDNRQQFEMVSLDVLVPEDHLLRKIEAAVNFDEIREFFKDLYCSDNGRPSVDPIVIIKMLFIKHLYGLSSLRRTASEVEVNVAYRWFIGYGLNKRTPHFSTLSYNTIHRFSKDTVDWIFEWILNQIDNAGYLEPDTVFIDGTHIKANANIHKRTKEAIPNAAKIYADRLMEEINEDRKAHGKKPFDDPKDGSSEEKTVIVSKSDPDSGLFHKGEHKMCFAYTAQTACDKHNYILGVTVNPGNMHDSVAFDGVYDVVIKRFPEVKIITADAGYKTPWICKRIIDDGRLPSLPYTRPLTKKDNLPWQDYVYDEYYDCVICPEYQILKYSTTNRDGQREYVSDPKICRNCPSRLQCTLSKKCQKKVSVHIWNDYLETAEDIRHSEMGKRTYRMRSETIERVFADAKEKHSMRYTLYRGIRRVTDWIKLKYAAMNLKKYAIRKWLDGGNPPLIHFLRILYTIFFKSKIKTSIFSV